MARRTSGVPSERASISAPNANNTGHAAVPLLFCPSGAPVGTVVNRLAIPIPLLELLKLIKIFTLPNNALGLRPLC
jgi:hypothetical protein